MKTSPDDIQRTQSKSRSRTKDSKTNFDTSIKDLSQVKLKLDSTLSKDDNSEQVCGLDDDSSGSKLQECNRNLVEELCGASIEDIDESEKKMSSEYSVVSPDSKGLEIDEIIKSSIEKSRPKMDSDEVPDSMFAVGKDTPSPMAAYSS